ncbi:MAG: hypothetical protein KKA76_05600 [Proteobacteria bacterium]|nr:hypothetical protein [Pseudomonadota bacterium]
MNNIIQILLPILSVLLCLAPSPTLAESILTRINKVDGKDTIELYCSFTKTPGYRTNIREKRVDFILENTKLKPDFTFFEPDEKIVKILSLDKNNKTIISFFFRYPPQQFNVVPNENEGKMTVNILLGNPYSAALPDFSAKLEGLTLVKRTTKDYSNPLVASPYAADWKSFFRIYESKVTISLPIQITALPFPAITLLPPEREKNRTLLDPEIYKLADQKLWDETQTLLLKSMTMEKDPEVKKKLALTYGDALLREGNFPDAYKQFYLLAEEYAEEEIGVFAQYLLALLRAKFQDPYIADYELRNLEPFMTPANPLTPYFLLTQIETALATGQLERMRELLNRDDIPYPGQTVLIKELRQADYWYATGDSIKAYVGYQLLEKHDILPGKTFSLNGYCDTLYQQKKFPEAALYYTMLANHIDDKQLLGIINYRRHMAELHYKPELEMADYFARIENTYPGTDAGFRGALKKTDIKYINLKNWSSQALLYYEALAEKSVTRAAREEASFKEALVYSLNNEKIKSINLLMEFLRNFRNGELYETGQALLIELLPQVIKEYVQKGMYMDALVIAKQNRKLFLKNWVDISLLAEMAQSYHALGIFNEASKLYLYLINISSEDQKEMYYLPLISAAYDHGDYKIVEDYSDQYSYHYPKGIYGNDILLLRIKSLIIEDHYQEANKLLPHPIPDSVDFSLIAASLYFHENNYSKVVETLEQPIEVGGEQRSRIDFMLAESLFQLGIFDKAAKLYATIPISSIHHDQSLYRLAELAKDNGDNEASLKIYGELVETGKNPLWIKLAQKELEYANVTQ